MGSVSLQHPSQLSSRVAPAFSPVRPRLQRCKGGQRRQPGASPRCAVSCRQRGSAVQVKAGLVELVSGVMAAHAPPAVLTTTLQFTPVSAAVGGLVLGVAALGKLAITGRILGISGVVRGLVRGDWSQWRLVHIAGILIGGTVAAAITPFAFDVLPASYSYGRAALGGLLVGFGAALGNGCTSGHGICGNARFSARSFMSTVLFMLAGIATATLTNSADAAGIVAQAAPLTWPSKLILQQGLLLLPMTIATMAFVTSMAQSVAHSKDDPRAINTLTELITGVMFAFGLVYSGMVRPTKVIGFLSLLHPARDLSLLFVMAGALAVAAPGFHAVLRGRQKLTKPLAGERFMLPIDNSSIDSKLVLGALLFGAGWGLSGICPGPALVALARPNIQVVAYAAAMCAGMWLEWVAVSKPAAQAGAGKSATA